ncbi:MAG: hypothetical protein ACI9MC_002004 [Kiritimatiellia bacterium]|jgi:hypothetical protein
MSSRDDLLSALQPALLAVKDLDLSHAANAERALSSTYSDAEFGSLAALVHAAVKDGWMTPRKATETLLFGRIAKPSDATFDLSIDAVNMEGVGAAHTHPRGEVSLCFHLSGEPLFDGHGGRWVVKEPGTRHAPTVTGGRMAILYFLPGGAISW